MIQSDPNLPGSESIPRKIRRARYDYDLREGAGWDLKRECRASPSTKVKNLDSVDRQYDAAYRNGVRKLLFLGSSCVYPKVAPQPIKEEYLLTGILEPTNDAYAIAKIAGIKMCQAYGAQYGFRAITAMPTNAYGPNDNFDLETAHVLAALLRKFHEAKVSEAPTVTVWGTGTPRREFLHVDDLADACVFLMQVYDGSELINVGVGEDLSIRELSDLIAQVVGFSGHVVYDPSKPDGTPRKVLDVSRLRALGWQPRITLGDGILQTYRWYCERFAALT